MTNDELRSLEAQADAYQAEADADRANWPYRRIDALTIALKRLVAKARGVDVLGETPDQEQARRHFDVALELAREVIEGKKPAKPAGGK